MSAATTKSRKVRARRRASRVPPLDRLRPHERLAFLQEALDQNALFRQIAAASNGVTGPIERNIIPEFEVDEEVESNEEDLADTSPEPATEKPVTDSEPKPDPEPVHPQPEPDTDTHTQPNPCITKDDLADLLDRDSSRWKKVVAGGIGATLLSVLLGMLGLRFLSPNQPAVTSPSNGNGGSSVVVSTKSQLLDLLGKSGYSLPDTALSNTATRVYEYDPNLRDKHLQELQDTFNADP